MTPSFGPELNIIGNYRMIVQLQGSFSNESKYNNISGRSENCCRHTVE